MQDSKAIRHRLGAAAQSLAKAGFAPDDCALQPFDADASLRHFVRMQRPDGQTAICVLDCGYVADYLAKPLAQTEKLWPIALVSAFGQRHQIPMSQVYTVDQGAAIALIEDLGNERLDDRLLLVADDAIDSLFSLSFSLLARLRAATPSAIAENHFVAWREWDRATIVWEIDHFFDECWDRFAKDDGSRHELRTALIAVAEEIVSIPTVLMHRDFHSRNLMMTGPMSLAVIDYEDMLIGREGYDAAAIIADTYLFDRLDADKINHLFDLWARSQNQPVRWVRLCAMQRMLRTAGRFAWLAANVRGDHWLEHIPRAIARAEVAATGQADLQDLMREVGRAIYPALKEAVRT